MLPIWVDVMNSSFAKYLPVEIPQPKALKKYEICLSSGQLATDKCVETTTDKTSGQTVDHHTTYFELGTPEQAPKQYCTVHGEGAGATFAQAAVPISNVPIQSQYPRATLAVDLGKVAPIPMKAPTVTGDDPYQSVKPTIVLPAIPVSNDSQPSGSAAPGPSATPPQETQVRRAEPVRALDQPAEDATIKVPPPPAIQF